MINKSPDDAEKCTIFEITYFKRMDDLWLNTVNYLSGQKYVLQKKEYITLVTLLCPWDLSFIDKVFKTRVYF
jgi:hypothetical protein